MPFKQSFCYPMFKAPDQRFLALCRAAAEIGYDGIELWARPSDFNDLVLAARETGLVIASMCGHGTTADGLNNPANHGRIEAELRQSIAIAAEVGIPNLICFSGNRREGQSDADAIATCADALRRVMPLAEKHGIRLNLELLNSKVPHRGYQADHTAWGVALCRQVGSPNLKLLYDIYHMQVMEGDVVRTIQQNIQWIGHFHTAGNPGRNDLDEEQELNYPAICRAIAATGFDGFVAHEFKPKGDALAALRAAYRTCAIASA